MAAELVEGAFGAVIPLKSAGVIGEHGLAGAGDRLAPIEDRR